MSPASRTAAKAAIIGILFGVYVVLHDDLPLWRTMSDLDPVLATARVIGSVAGWSNLVRARRLCLWALSAKGSAKPES